MEISSHWGGFRQVYWSNLTVAERFQKFLGAEQGEGMRNVSKDLRKMEFL